MSFERGDVVYARYGRFEGPATVEMVGPSKHYSIDMVIVKLENGEMLKTLETELYGNVNAPNPEPTDTVTITREDFERWVSNLRKELFGDES